MSEVHVHNKLLVLLLDGFRWDYIDKEGLELPGFKQILREGVRADYLEPVFPSLSYPNYYSIMTGLYCEDHGMVGNYMYDEERNERFNNMDNPECKDPHWWEGAEPFWITSVKQGKRTSMYKWSGSEIVQNGVKSTFCVPVDADSWPTLLDVRVNLQKTIEQIKNDEIDMAGIFVYDIDKWGHILDTNSQEFHLKLLDLDTVIKWLLDELNTDPLRNKVNLVIFSDHGMAEVSQERTVDISTQLGSPDVKMFTDRGHMCNVWPHDGKTEDVYLSLKELNNDHITVYKKDQLPDRWRCKNHRRVPPITVVAEIGWFILTPEYPSFTDKGFHGYDNKEVDMRGIFLATGPDIKTDTKIGPMKAVDVYQILCKLLQVSPQTHSGDWSAVQNIFI